MRIFFKSMGFHSWQHTWSITEVALHVVIQTTIGFDNTGDLDLVFVTIFLDIYCVTLTWSEWDRKPSLCKQFGDCSFVTYWYICGKLCPQFAYTANAITVPPPHEIHWQVTQVNWNHYSISYLFKMSYLYFPPKWKWQICHPLPKSRVMIHGTYSRKPFLLVTGVVLGDEMLLTLNSLLIIDLPVVECQVRASVLQKYKFAEQNLWKMYCQSQHNRGPGNGEVDTFILQFLK